MEHESSENRLKMRELDYKMLVLKKEKLIDIIKIITTAIVVTLVPAIINYQIQQQEVEIARLKGEIEYLDKFSDNVVQQDDLLKRRNFVEYLATMAHSDKSRERWDKYYGIVNDLVEKQEEFDRQITAKELEAKRIDENLKQLKSQIEQANIVESDELNKLKERLAEANAELQSVESEILVETSKKETFIQKSKLSSTEIDSSALIQGLVQQMNSSDRSTRLNSVAKLIENHKSSPLAISLSLDLLEPLKINTLTASGRINVLVFLRNTSPTSWQEEHKEKASAAITRIRASNQTEGLFVGPQTEDALAKLEDFIALLQ